MYNKVSGFFNKTEAGILINPAHRIGLPSTLPDVIDIAFDGVIQIDEIDQALRLHGQSLHTVNRINIAFPKKHPLLFPGHYNGATGIAQNLCLNAAQRVPSIQWVLMDSLSELRKLNRTGNQGSLHALTKRQDYVVYEPRQAEIETLKSLHRRPEFFLLVDDTIDRGTTLANLYSFITYNGGTVIGVAARAFAYRDPVDKAQPLQLANAFSMAAERQGIALHPAAALELFNEHLKGAWVNTLETMTSGERARVAEDIQDSDLPLMDFLRLLKKDFYNENPIVTKLPSPSGQP